MNGHSQGTSTTTRFRLIHAKEGSNIDVRYRIMMHGVSQHVFRPLFPLRLFFTLAA